ncbi:MAG: PadR family transcriptional regulator [Anaerolineales bacterium]
MIDIQETHKKFRKELSSGTVSLALLSILAQTKEPLYGYQIGKLIGSPLGSSDKKAKADSVTVKQGAIYPVLRSLEAQDLLSSEREMTDSGPPRKYYRVTESGKQALEAWTAIWNETKTFLDNVLGGDYQ